MKYVRLRMGFLSLSGVRTFLVFSQLHRRAWPIPCYNLTLRSLERKFSKINKFGSKTTPTFSIYSVTLCSTALNSASSSGECGVVTPCAPSQSCHIVDFLSKTELFGPKLGEKKGFWHFFDQISYWTFLKAFSDWGFLNLIILNFPIYDPIEKII